MVLPKDEYSKIIEHTKRCLKESPNPYDVIAYCSERISQIPFQLGFPNDSYGKREQIISNLLFFNRIIQRVAFLNKKTLESSVKSPLEKDPKIEQVDLFLNEVGYKENSNDSKI
jgi:hypothetical protein